MAGPVFVTKGSVPSSHLGRWQSSNGSAEVLISISFLMFFLQSVFILFLSNYKKKKESVN